MNGWELHYKNGDHHVAGLGSTIANINHARTADEFVLTWEAGGADEPASTSSV